MTNGFNNVGNAITENRFAAKDCCCETNRNIDSVKYENAQNTCVITTAIHNEGAETRALITANTMQNLRDKLADKDRELLASGLLNAQQIQTQTLVGTLRPFPQPAYTTAYNPCGTNCGCCN